MPKRLTPLCLASCLAASGALAATGNVDVYGTIIHDSTAPAGFAATGQLALMSLSESGRALNGAHSRPLSRRAPEGENLMWIAGDWGRVARSGDDDDVSIGELGLGRKLGALQANLALGRGTSEQHLPLGGRLDHDGTYLLAEAMAPLQGTLWGVLGAYYQWGEASIRRHYLTGVLPDASWGDTDTRSWALRARLEWDEAVKAGRFGLSPYAELAYMHSRVDGYTETGGASPLRLTANTQHNTLLRLGAHGTLPIARSMRLLGLVEGVHRFEDSPADVFGEVIGQSSYVVLGQSTRRNYLRLGAGFEAQVGDGHATLMLNHAEVDGTPNTWVAAAYQHPF